jgi:membrane-associated protease RseP (regulator of RpoE activity)
MSALVALAAGTVFAIGRPVFAAEGEHEEGRIVELSAEGAGSHDHAIAEAEEQAPGQPTYWLGIQGEPLTSSVLRTHLQLADDVGVVIANVVKDSPAEKAGLRVHDVLLAVNGEQLTDMTMLQQAVAASHGKPIELTIIRLAKEATLQVTPERRPEHIAAEELLRDINPLQGNLPMGDLNALLQKLQQQGMPGGARMFGPGMVFNGQAMAQIPGGVQVSITRQNDEPPTVTVKKGDQTWTIKGDDKEALAKLPDDVRPFVERMLAGQQPGGATVQLFDGDLGGILPNGLGQFDVDVDAQFGEALEQRAEALHKHAEEASRKMMQRMEEMEKRLQQMQQRLEQENSSENGNQAADPTKA